VPPGIADSVTPNPLFSFTPSATVDEGNNWINVSWGPLALTNPTTLPTGGNYGGGPALANYNLQATSPVINLIPANQPHPPTDFYGNMRPEPGEATNGGHFDPGAIEFGSSMGTPPAGAAFSVSLSSLAFGSQSISAASAPLTITVTNTGGVNLAGGTFTVTGSTAFTGSGCTATLAVGATCTYAVVFRPAAVTSYSGSVAIAYTGVTAQAVSFTGTGVATGALGFSAATNATLGGTAGHQTLTFNRIPTPRAPVTSVVTITNTGTAATPTAVTIGNITVAGIADTLFSLTGNTCGATLATGATCTISILYATPPAPPNPQHRDGTAAVPNNGSGTNAGSTNLALSGK
jgi:hypothetical protein